MSVPIEQLTWLSADVAVLVAGAESAGALEAKASLDGEAAEVRWMTFGGPDNEKLLLVLQSARPIRTGEAVGPLSTGSGDTAITFEPADLGMVSVDLQTLLRTSLAPVTAGTREQIVSFLAAVAGELPSTDGRRLRTGLASIREALRERLAPCIVDRAEPIGLAVECMLAISETRFFVQGWFRDVNDTAVSLRAVSPEGSSAELLDRVYRFRRPDLEVFYGVAPGDPAAGTGFACCFDVDSPTGAAAGWIFELRSGAGNGVEVAAPRVISAYGEVRDMLLSDVALERPGEDTLIRRHIFPAITTLQERNAHRLRIDRVVQLGQAPADPLVTIVVPLYRRIDFLQHQLAQFALDPEIAECDLIYVLDSPELAHDLISFASSLSDLFPVPFRVVTLAQNVGYAGANNAGAALARGRLLLLLNSDVLPERPGWVGAMADFYDSTPRVGALGPKLVFEDESIQHAGLLFRKRVNSAFWINDHYFKGLHRDVGPANVSRRVPAVTGACLMVDRALFDEAGGLRGCFVRGDFEDSDFCLRLVESGHENWYCADVALHHLEGQSYESALRQRASTYNAWLQTYLWGDQIAGLMSQFAEDPSLARPAPKKRLPAVRSVSPGRLVEKMGAK